MCKEVADLFREWPEGYFEWAKTANKKEITGDLNSTDPAKIGYHMCTVDDIEAPTSKELCDPQVVFSALKEVFARDFYFRFKLKAKNRCKAHGYRFNLLVDFVVQAGCGRLVTRTIMEEYDKNEENKCRDCSLYGTFKKSIKKHVRDIFTEHMERMAQMANSSYYYDPYSVPEQEEEEKDRREIATTSLTDSAASSAFVPPPPAYFSSSSAVVSSVAAPLSKDEDSDDSEPEEGEIRYEKEGKRQRTS